MGSMPDSPEQEPLPCRGEVLVQLPHRLTRRLRQMAKKRAAEQRVAADVASLRSAMRLNPTVRLP